MATVYIDIGGNATNSGGTDTASPLLSGSGATVAGSVVTLDGSPDLTGLITTAGPTQSTIRLADATNADKKIFRITAFNNVLKTVTVAIAPTGITSSAWSIGGQLVYSSADFEGFLVAGDVVTINNSPASKTGAFFTCRAAGGVVDGRIKVIGKTGTRPKLTVTDTGNVIVGGNNALWHFENLEFEQQGASGTTFATVGSNWIVRNVKVSDSGGACFTPANGHVVSRCEFSGIGGDVYTAAAVTNCTMFGNYLHDCGANALTFGTFAHLSIWEFNIIDTMGGRGLHLSGAPAAQNQVLALINNTIYGCGNSGLEVADADFIVRMNNCVFVNNGDAAGEYNVEWTAGTAELLGLHDFNVFYSAGGGGSANVLGLTLTANESSADPQLVDPANGDFRLAPGSIARNFGRPGAFVGGPTGFLDAGAVQQQHMPKLRAGLQAITGGLAA